MHTSGRLQRFVVGIRIVACAALALAAAPSVARAQWAASQPLSAQPSRVGFRSGPYLATDSQGRVHTVYVRADLPYYRERDPIAGWGAETPLSALTKVITYMAVATDCIGNVHVVWARQAATNVPAELRYRSRSPAGVWGAEVVLRTLPTKNDFFYGLTLSADIHGNAFAVWSEVLYDAKFAQSLNIMFRVYSAETSTWLPLDQLTSNPHDGLSSILPRTAVQNAVFDPASGRLVTLWHTVWFDANLGIAFRAIKMDPVAGYSLVGASNVSVGQPFEGFPSIAARCNKVHIVCRDLSGGLGHFIGTVLIQNPLAVTFVTSTPIAIDGYSLDLALDGLGNAHLAVGGSSGGNARLMHARWSATQGTWSFVGLISNADVSVSSITPSIGADELGNLHVVWNSEPPGAAQYSFGDCFALPLPQEGPARAFGAHRSPAPSLAARPHSTKRPVLVMLRAQPDLSALGERTRGMSALERRRAVTEELRRTGAPTQVGVLERLNAAEKKGAAARIRPLWLVNAIAADLDPGTIDELTARPDVAAVVDDAPEVVIEDAKASHARVAAQSAPDATRSGSVRSPAGLRPRSAGALRASDPQVAWGVDWIGAPQAWAQGYHGECVLVAVLDTGVELLHPDLRSRIWTNAEEMPGDAVDNDGNGLVDDVHGYDFVNSDPDPSDDNGHGTAVAGIIAGDGTLGTITGVATQASIMAVKVCDASGAFTSTQVLAGMQYALANGAQVLNLSLGRNCPDAATRQAYRNAADALRAAGVTMVVEAGDGHCADRPPNALPTPADVPPPWNNPGQPAIGTASGVTTVGATGFMNNVVTASSGHGPIDWSQPVAYGDWRLCNVNPAHVALIKPDVCAPGEDISSTLMGAGYTGNTLDGTSYAAPHVAGLAALLLSKNDQLVSSDIHGILELSALDLGPGGKENDSGAGRVRAPDALSITPAAPVPTVVELSHQIDDPSPLGNGDGLLNVGETANVVVQVQNGGPYLLGSMSGGLTTNSVYVHSNSGPSAFGDVPAGQSGSNSGDPFVVQVESNQTSGAIVAFTVNLQAYGACGSIQFDETIQPSVIGVSPPSNEMLPVFEIGGVLPNPAPGAATFTYAMRDAGRVVINIFDVQGRRVCTVLDGRCDAGRRTAVWDGRDAQGRPAPQGVYSAQGEHAGIVSRQRFVLMSR